MTYSFYKKIFIGFLLFLVSAISFLGNYLVVKHILSSNMFMESLVLFTLYFFQEKCWNFIAPFLYLGGSIFAYFIFFSYFSYFNFEKMLGSHILIFFTIPFFLYTLLFQKIINKWSEKKIIMYFVYFGLVFIIFQYLLMILVSFVQYSNTFNPQNYSFGTFLKHQLFHSIDASQSYESFLSSLLKNSMFGFNSMFQNIRLFVTSSFSTLFIIVFFLDLQNKKFDSFNILVPRKYKVVFLWFAICFILSFLFKYYILCSILASFILSMCFLFFLIGREILLNIFYSLYNNIMVVHFMFMTLSDVSTYFFSSILILGFVEVFFQIFNPNRELK